MLLFALVIAFSVIGHVTSSWYAGQQVNTLLGVTPGAVSAYEVYGAGYDGTHGFVYYNSARGNAGTGTTITTGTGVNLDITITDDNSALCVVGANGLYYGIPNGAASTFQQSTSFSTVISQDVEEFGSQGCAAVGRFDGVNGVAISLDGGHTYTSYGINIANVNDGYVARYGAFPSTNVWYVTAGTWPFDTDEKLSNGRVARVSSRLSITFNAGQGGPSTTFMSARHLLGSYPGAIYKTTDYGSTWTSVYNSEGAFYLNQIDCSDVNTCVAVGENAKSAIVLSTSNGGTTWNTLLTLAGPYSLHSVQVLSATEFFVGGGTPSVGPYATKQIVGYYYHTTDAGANWDLTELNGYGYDLCFWDDTQGYASVIFREASYVWTWQT